MLYSVNLEQDVCVGSCLHLLNALFVTEWSRKVGTGGGTVGITFTQLTYKKLILPKNLMFLFS